MIIGTHAECPRPNPGQALSSLIRQVLSLIPQANLDQPDVLIFRACDRNSPTRHTSLAAHSGRRERLVPDHTDSEDFLARSF